LDTFNIYESDGIEYCEKNEEIYHSASNIIRLMNEHNFYGIDFIEFANGNLRFYDKNKNTLIENVPYEMIQNRIFIPKTYYENTMLPLIV